MKRFIQNTPLVASLALIIATPALAQTAGEVSLETRVRKVESEVSAIQRVVFPGGDGRFFPQIQPSEGATAPAGTPASNPSTDMLTRMDALEGQVARLTSQVEEDRNRLDKLEARLAALEPGKPAGGEVAAGSASSSNLAAMTGGASVAAPAAQVAAAKPAPAATKPAAKAATPSAQRVAAVRAIEKPQTQDPADDEYSYGFRLWEAKFYPEAQQQLKLFLDKYPRHPRRSFARNLLGRSLLDDGKPEEAQKWFLENYKDQQFRDRAADSVVFLAEATKRQKDTARACIALAQFVDEFPREAAGRLKSQYDATRAGLKCD